MPRTSRAKIKRGKSLRVFEPGSGAEKSQQLMLYQRALKELVREGYVQDPALRKRIAAGWHPGIEMAVMTTQPDLPDLIRATCYKVLLDSMATEQKLNSSEPNDLKITVVVPAWAAGPSPKQALPAPKEIDRSDVFTIKR
jgi:hypothetical protein